MFLVDTNVISEARKGAKADRGVQAFLHATAIEDIYLAVQTVGELCQGLERIRARGDAPQSGLLERWLALQLARYEDRILDFDRECAQVWGRLMAIQPHNPIDKQIAAIALIHDLTIVTRNTQDFEGTGVSMVNPFSLENVA